MKTFFAAHIITIALMSMASEVFAQDLPATIEFTPELDATSYVVYEVNEDGSLTEVGRGPTSPINFTVPLGTTFMAVVMTSVAGEYETPPGIPAVWSAPVAPIEPIIITRPPSNAPTVIVFRFEHE